MFLLVSLVGGRGVGFRVWGLELRVQKEGGLQASEETMNLRLTGDSGRVG